MKSPFKDNFDDARKDSAIVGQDSRTKKEISEELLQNRRKSNQLISKYMTILIVAFYAAGRSHAPMSKLLTAIYLDKIMLFSALPLFPICMVFYFVYSIKDWSNGFLYVKNERNIKSFFSYGFYFPERKHSPIYAMYRGVKIIIITEIAISSFFILDYLFDL